MGKASSSKKVARAARAGGKTTGQRRNLGFPAAIVVICVLGVGLVAFARQSSPGGGPPTLEDHWHAAYGIYVCDRWVQTLSDRGADTLGIHTHDDGLVHIHPFLAGATGEAATLGKWFDQTGMKVTDTSITLPPTSPWDEREYKEGETTCGDEQGEVVVAKWKDASNATGEPDEVVTSDIGGLHFSEDHEAITIAFLPEGTDPSDIPVPPSAADIVALGAADGGSGQPVDGQPENSDRPDDSGSDSSDTDSTEAPADTSSETSEAPADTASETESTEAPAEGSESTEAPAETTAPAG